MDQDHDGELEAFDAQLAYPRCLRKTKRGTLCQNKAGKGTVHEGRGACRFHGGIKDAERDRRLKTGIYSTVSDVRVSTILEEVAARGDTLDVTQELNLARALLIDWTERYTQLRDALLSWNERRDEEAPPARVPELKDLFPALETISRIVYRVERSSSDKYIPRGTFYRVMMAMGRAVDMRVLDENVREQIRQDWLKIETV